MSSAGKNPESSSQRVVWRSLEQKRNPSIASEDCGGSDVVKQTIATDELWTLRRRNFLTLGGAMTALAGIEGCIRRPVENIMPYTEMPEYVNPGVAMSYATVTERNGEALGLLVTSYEGRPTKIEGNPDHPTSRGSTDLLAQAAILDLYDPERARAPLANKAKSTFADFDAFVVQKLGELGNKGGEGLRVLAQPSRSPTFLRARKALLARLPKARVHTYAPINQSAVRAGTKLAFGQTVGVSYDYSQAKTILALDSDFLMTESGSVLASRQFAVARNMDSAAGEMNRLYVVEPALSVTGSNADHRLRMPAQDVLRYAKALATELATNHGIELSGLLPAVRGASTEGIPAAWLSAVGKELVQSRGVGLIVAGARQPAELHALVFALNSALGNAGRTVTYVEPFDTEEADCFADLAALTADMAAGKVDTLLILGGNPAHDAPADLAFGASLAKVGTTIHCSSHADETSALCTWLIPRAAELETWGDQQTVLGQYSVQQPLLAPLWGGRSDLELVGQFAGVANWRGHEQVKATVEERGMRGELAWRRLLHRGVAESNHAAVLGSLPINQAMVASALQKTSDAAPLDKDNLELVFAADAKLFDGRHANNTWLLELPDPITRITWDNAALLAPATAKALGIKNGDLVRIQKGDASIDIVAWQQPGIANNTVALTVGWGRKRAGSNGNGCGFDVYPLRSSAAPGFAAGASLKALGRKYKISQTQEQNQMRDPRIESRDRPMAIDATLAEYKEKPNFPEYESPDPAMPPLWERQDYTQGQQWGMVVDLNTCTGCSTCVIACQAENNVSVVGKDQVARGRAMHWFRIDRYYVGENEDEPEVAFQPIGCQHCEEAPCENVCPVAATSHSPEGLNDIAYNRCIGTRYCMNNCPYKVRRFNFLNLNLNVSETEQMQFNPNVTVRFRGVIEKCSYCVQRIQMAKSKAKQAGRATVREGDVKAACQQACPANAIAFGDLNDHESEVSRWAKRDRNYALLAEVGTHPRTRFLGKIRNPNPEMKS